MILLLSTTKTSQKQESCDGERQKRETQRLIAQKRQKHTIYNTHKHTRAQAATRRTMIQKQEKHTRARHIYIHVV